jgi:hypothetical protein
MRAGADLIGMRHGMVVTGKPASMFAGADAREQYPPGDAVK